MNPGQTLDGAIPDRGALPADRNGIARGRGLVALFVPNVAVTFALVTLLSLFFVFSGATSLFNDSDTGWHIVNGETIISTGLLPHSDPFSFSKPGAPWIAWEWGSDVLMGAVYRVSGLAGIALMFGLCIAASVWMWFRLNRAAGGNFLLAGLFFIPMLPTTTLHWLARPHIFSWLFLLGTVWICERMPSRFRWPCMALAAAGGAVWANLHASFFFGPLIALAYAAGAYLKPRIWETRAGEFPRDGRGFLQLALAASLGTLANPSGWNLHRHVFSYLFDSGLMDHITEFQSFDFHQAGADRVMLTLAICSGGAFAALSARQPGRFFLSLLLTAAALRSTRALPMAALLVLPLANGSITAVLARANDLTRRFRQGLDRALQYGNRLQEIDRRFRGFALIPLAAVLIFVSIRNRAGFPAATFPVAASAIVASLPVNSRILAPDQFGGYLIFRFRGERKVFVDGRSDFYGKEVLGQYLELMDARGAWREEFNRWSFTQALLPPACPLILALKANGWRELYRDRTAVLLTGNPRL